MIKTYLVYRNVIQRAEGRTCRRDMYFYYMQYERLPELFRLCYRLIQHWTN